VKIIAIANLKGGVGKTMLTVNLSAVLAEDFPVLLIDADPQSNATSGLGIDIASREYRSMIHVLSEDGGVDAASVIMRSPIKELPLLDLLPSDLALTRTELQLVSYPSREQVLSRWINKNQGVLAQYEYIFIDTGPNIGLINQNVLFVADSIILVTDISKNGQNGVEMLSEYWASLSSILNTKNNISALIVNNYDKRIRLSQELVEYFKNDEYFSCLLVNTVIPNRVALKDTEVDQEPINLLHPKHDSLVAYRSIIRELEEKGVL